MVLLVKTLFLLLGIFLVLSDVDSVDLRVKTGKVKKERKVELQVIDKDTGGDEPSGGLGLLVLFLRFSGWLFPFTYVLFRFSFRFREQCFTVHLCHYWCGGSSRV